MINFSKTIRSGKITEGCIEYPNLVFHLSRHDSDFVNDHAYVTYITLWSEASRTQNPLRSLSIERAASRKLLLAKWDKTPLRSALSPQCPRRTSY